MTRKQTSSEVPRDWVEPRDLSSPIRSTEHPSNDLFLTTEELAKRWHTTPAGVHNQVYRGLGLRSYRIGKRRLYKLADVIEFEETRREHGEPIR